MTREDIVREIETVENTVKISMAPGLRDAVADTLLARLRPVWEREQEHPGPKYPSSQSDFCPAGIDEAKHTACEHIRADLRVVVKTLQNARNTICALPHPPPFERPFELGLQEIDTALARPGVCAVREEERGSR